MATRQDLPVTDSAAVLHELVGDDATAAFESDPKFSESNPTVDASSEHLETRADRQDLRAQPDLKLNAADDDDDEEDEDDEDEDDLDDDDELEDDDEELDDDEDDDEEYEDDDDDDEADDDEDEDEE